MASDAVTIVLGCSGIVGTLLGILLSYLNVNRNINRQTLQNARSDFRAVFSNTLARYNLTDGTAMIEIMLKEEIPKQAAAIERFRHFIKTKDREAYQKTWEDYYRFDDSLSDRDLHFIEYSAYEDRKEVFKKRIETILKFAKL
jgi:hypothetical protein